MEKLHDTAMGCHLPYGITQCYLLPDTSEHTPPSAQPDRLVYSIYRPFKGGGLSKPRRGVFTCVWWKVTLCDPLWQMTPHSCEMELINSYTGSFWPFNTETFLREMKDSVCCRVRRWWRRPHPVCSQSPAARSVPSSRPPTWSVVAVRVVQDVLVEDLPQTAVSSLTPRLPALIMRLPPTMNTALVLIALSWFIKHMVADKESKKKKENLTKLNYD